MPLWIGVILILISATSAIAGVILWLRLRDEKAWAWKREMELSQKNSELEKALREERERLIGQVQKIAELEAEAGGLHKRLAEQLEQKGQDQEFLKLQFQSLSQKLFDHYSQLMQAQAGKEISQVLAPLRDQLGQFHQSLQQKYETELKERHSLKNEIERLIQMNDRMLLEANQLTQALRGDNKVQGDWGELVLERILEASGLKQGQEYEVQESKLSEEGERYRPDVLIYLPEGRHIVIDSKVSLKSYESYRQAGQEEERQQHLEAFFQSVKRHIDGLSAKSYQKLKGVNSPDFVFLFFPIEPAYLLLMREHPDLAMEAWKKGVALVTSTTLLTSLKTVASIWRVEKQNKNAQEIAQEAAKMYDKFVGFLDDFEKMGRLFEQGQRQYQEALGKLRDGPGNVFRKMEKLKELGAPAQKALKSDYLDS